MRPPKRSALLVSVLAAAPACTTVFGVSFDDAHPRAVDGGPTGVATNVDGTTDEPQAPVPAGPDACTPGDACPSGQPRDAGQRDCGGQGAWSACEDSHYSFESCTKYCASVGKCCTNTCKDRGGESPTGLAGSWTDTWSSSCSPADKGGTNWGTCGSDWGGNGHFWFQCCCS